jgi:acylphosphatase
MQPVRAHLTITGRVQGVFYRAFTRDLAARFSLRGWVRNLPDGNVEALFEGYRDDVDKAITRCHSGPPGSNVDHIEVKWEEYKGDLKGFQIRYY